MELTREYFDKGINNLATRTGLKNVADDVKTIKNHVGALQVEVKKLGDVAEDYLSSEHRMKLLVTMLKKQGISVDEAVLFPNS